MAGTMIQQHCNCFSHLDYRRQFERTIRTTGEDPANFATALEMLAVKAFGDMGQTARLRLNRDRFIAGHSNCDLRQHLDSAPPETPIRDVVDRCRVWESHADPAVRRISKPTPDPMYLTYTVGETDSNNEITRVAAVTGLKSDQNQLMEVIRRVVSNTERPNPKTEIQDILGRLQQLLREPVPKTLEQMLRSLFDGQRQRQRQPPRLRQQRRDWTDVVCFSCGRLGHTATRCPDFNVGRNYDDTATGNNRPPAGRKRRLIREGGSASRVSIHARPRDPGGGTVSTHPRRRTVLHDVSVSVEQPREEPTLVSPTCSTVQTGQASADDTHNQECSHDVVGLCAHMGTMWNTDDRVPQKDIKSPYGGGVSTLPGAAGGPPSSDVSSSSCPARR